MGKVGVYLFFVLSAYLLDAKITSDLKERRTTSGYWKNYFLRRFLRIYPLFVSALLAYGSLTLIGLDTVIDEFYDIPLHLLLVKGESIFWSIPVEFKYYFISPILLMIFHELFSWNKKKTFVFIVTLSLISVVFEVVFDLPLVSTFRYIPIFLSGTFIAVFEILEHDKVREIASSKSFSIYSITILALIILSTPHFSEQIFSERLHVHSTIYYLPYGLAWGSILLSAKYGNGLIEKILKWKALRFVGVISFSLYLCHILVLRFVTSIGSFSNHQIYWFFLFSILISTASYLLIEKPLSMIRYRSKHVTNKIH
jgi:peptidoglycan/LPS O-acetylase OafA/YrhL